MNYFEMTDKVSQSRLKKILIHPRMYMSKLPAVEEDEKIHFIVGNAVDCLLTESDKFNDLYYVLTTKAPTGQVKQFIDKYHEYGGNSDEAFSAVNSQKYKQEWFEEKMKESDNQSYLAALQHNKAILDPKTYDTILEIVGSLTSFKEYKDLITKTPSNQIISQLEIFWKHEGIDMKSKLDFVVIDFEKKTILPIDVKTMGDSTSAFKYSFWKRRYDFQAASYTLALEHWQNDSKNFSTLKGFKILPFKFVVESSKYQGSPLVYEVSPETMEIGLNGGENDGKTYEGLKQAIERLKWHTESNIWDYTREQWESNRTLLI